MVFTHSCAGCDRPGAPLCRTCRFALADRRSVTGPDGVVTALPFTGRVRDVMLGFKYRNRRAVAAHLAGVLVNRLARARVRPDVVTWAPTSAGHRHQRGFDQAELVARQVARQLGVPCRPLLQRSRDAGGQTGRSRHQRLDATLAFRARPALGHVLVVDDVVTTGATLRAAGAALRNSGAGEVTLAAVAATPATTARPVRRPRAA